MSSYLFLIALLVTIFYKWVKRNNDFFKKRGISYVEPTFMLGNTSEFLFKKISLADLSQKLYSAFPSERLIGFFNLMTPIYLIRDPEIFKQISIKDFESFEDRGSFINPEVDSLFANSIVFLNGAKWHEMRTMLSPAFTGSKMRLMFDLVCSCAQNASNYLHDMIENGNVTSFELTDIFTRFTTDAVATCSFGHNVNSFKERTNAFYRNGQRTSDNETLSRNLKFFIQSFAPKLLKMFNIELFESDVQNFFTKMVFDNMKSRQMRGISRPDLIDLFIQARKGLFTYQDNDQPPPEKFATVKESTIGKKKVAREWSDKEMVSQCFIFFVAGYDTVTSALLAAAYELALNVDVQKKLCDEIDENEQNLNGKPITYERLQKLKYLDMVVSEVLRIRPPVSFLHRICSKDFELQINERKIKINKGEHFWIPVQGYHHDPKYYPNPNKFDPERFSDANKGTINTAAYLHFGSGPRNCIGLRLALMEMKLIIYYLLKDFTLDVNSKTDIPMTIKPSLIGNSPQNGLHLNIKLKQ